MELCSYLDTYQKNRKSYMTKGDQPKLLERKACTPKTLISLDLYYDIGLFPCNINLLFLNHFDIQNIESIY